MWSTAWVRDPGTEIVSIEQALERARTGQAEYLAECRTGNNVDEIEATLPNEPKAMVVAPSGGQETPATSQFFAEYHHFKCRVLAVSTCLQSLGATL